MPAAQSPGSLDALWLSQRLLAVTPPDGPATDTTVRLIRVFV